MSCFEKHGANVVEQHAKTLFVVLLPCPLSACVDV